MLVAIWDGIVSLEAYLLLNVLEVKIGSLGTDHSSSYILVFLKVSGATGEGIATCQMKENNLPVFMKCRVWGLCGDIFSGIGAMYLWRHIISENVCPLQIAILARQSV